MQRILLLFFVLGATRSSSAATVLLKDRDEPVIGTIVKEDKDRVVVRIAEAGGKTHEETFRRSQVEEIVPAWSAQRLANLDPAKPADYRDYAEELRARNRDPEARDMALRLYLIAAWLDREQLGRASLLGMISLARSAAEEKKFRVALYLIDPRTPLESLQTTASETTDVEDKSTVQDLLRAVRMLRTGKGSTARSIAEKPAVAKLLESYSRTLSKAEFNAAAGESTLTGRTLRQVLALELELDSVLHPASTASRAATLSWSRELQGDGNKPVPSLALETLTEFDPRNCVYREGKWEARQKEK